MNRSGLKKIALIMVLLITILSSNLVLATTTLVQSDPPTEGNITVTNYAGISDTVGVVNIASGDSVTIKVYADPDLKRLLGKATVAKSASTVTVSIKQLGSTAGSVYVTQTSKGKSESDPTQCDYNAEIRSDAPDVNNIVVTNNAGSLDTVVVNGITTGDSVTVKVYSDPYLNVLLGQAKVNKNSVNPTSAKVSIKQLGTTAGSVYVTQTDISKGQSESDATEQDYIAEAKSIAPGPSNILVANYTGSPDTVTVSNLATGDTIKVYSDPDLKQYLGKATAKNTTAMVNIKQLGSGGGNIYVTITNSGLLESKATVYTFDAEAQSEAPDSHKILIINNTDLGHDLVVVYGLSSGDTITVYPNANCVPVEALGTDTVTSGQTQVVIDLFDLPSASGGTVYLTRKGEAVGMLESNPLAKAYSAE